MFREPPLEPHVERFTYEECPNCKETFVLHDELHGSNPCIAIAWFDQKPCCCESCRDKYVDEFSFEYEEEMNKKEIEELKKEANYAPYI